MQSSKSELCQVPERDERSPRCQFWLAEVPLFLFSHSVLSDSVTPWTVAHQASLSFTVSKSLLKLMSIDDAVQPSHSLSSFHSPAPPWSPGHTLDLEPWMSTCVCVQSCLTIWDPMDCSPPDSSVHGILQAWILPWVALLQGIFLTQGLNPGLLHRRRILYHWATGDHLLNL